MANKRYDQFTGVTPTPSRILLTADPSTGALGKCTTDALLTIQPSQDAIISALQTLGSPIKSSSCFVPPFYYNAVKGISINTLALYWNYLPACTVTGVYYALFTNGVFTAANFNGFAMYSADATTLTLIAQTANNANFFKTPSGAWAQAAFTSTVTVPAGNYWLALYYNASAQTTNPQLAISWVSDSFILNILGWSGGYKLAAEVGSGGSIQSSILWTAVPNANRLVPLCGFY